MSEVGELCVPPVTFAICDPLSLEIVDLGRPAVGQDEVVEPKNVWRVGTQIDVVPERPFREGKVPRLLHAV